MRHEVRQSNVPPTCENLFMHEKAGKASERDEGMGGNVAKRHSGEHKNKERQQKREQARERASERGKQDEHFVFVCDFLLIFSTLYSKAKVKWNGCPAEGRNGMAWNGMGWDSMHRLAELRSDR